MMMRSLVQTSSRVVRNYGLRSSVNMFPQTRSFHASVFSNKEEEELTVDNVGPGIIDKYKLYEPSRYLPLGIGILSALTASGLYHFNEESQLLGLWMLFCGTIYNKGGDALGNYLDDVKQQIVVTQSSAEDAGIRALEEEISAHKEAIEITKDVKVIVAATEELHKALLDSMPQRKAIAVTQFFESKLIHIAEVETSYKSGIEKRMLDKTNAKVLAKFATPEGKALKKKLVEAAVLALADPTKGNETDRIVGELFTSEIGTWKSRMDKIRNTELPVPADRQQAVKDYITAVANKEGLRDADGNLAAFQMPDVSKVKMTLV